MVPPYIVVDGVYSVDSLPYNHTYGYWIAEWWKWFVAIPYDSNPRPNYDKVGCAAGQKDDVIFLADIVLSNTTQKEIRDCTIPVGKSILLPIMNGICWTDSRDNPPWSNETLTKCARGGNEKGVISAFLDGKNLFNGTIGWLKSLRAESDFFNITVPNNDIFRPNSISGIWKAKVDGYFVFLEPLPPGNHTLRTTQSVLAQESPQLFGATDLTYQLVIQNKSKDTKFITG
jgi:hypothetical protein